MIWKWIFFSSLVTCLSVNISHFYYFYRYTWSISIKLDTTHFDLKDMKNILMTLENCFLRSHWTNNQFLQKLPMSKSMQVGSMICHAFLAYLSWKLKWAFLMTCRPSVCKLFTSNFIFFSRTTGPISTKLGNGPSILWW